MPIRAAANRASRRRSLPRGCPGRGGKPVGHDLDHAPRVSPANLVASISSIMAWLATSSRQRTSEASTRSSSPGTGITPAGALTEPIETMWLRIRMPAACSRNARATAPRATRARGLARTGSLEYRPGVIEVVFLHPGQIGVAGAGPGQRCVTGLLGRAHRHRPGSARHHRLPLGPLGVTDPNGHGRAHRHPVPHAAGELDLVGLELHPGPAPVPQASPGQIVGQILGRDFDARGQPVDYGHQCGAVAILRQSSSAAPAQSFRSSQIGDDETVLPDSTRLWWAGGSARRLGGIDKPGVPIGPTSLLDLVLSAVAGAARSWFVGRRPERPRCRCTGVGKSRPVGGPVAALAAGFAHIPCRYRAGTGRRPARHRAGRPGPVPPRSTATRTRRRPQLVDPTGRANHLAAAWRRPSLERQLRQADPVGRSIAITRGRCGASSRCPDPSGCGAPIATPGPTSKPPATDRLAFDMTDPNALDNPLEAWLAQLCVPSWLSILA